MKQLLQSISTGKASVADVPAPLVHRGQVLVRVMASLISAGTERSVVEFAEKNLLQKAMARPDLTRQLIQKAKREGWISTIEAARNRLDSELVLGYSNAGIVIEVGEGVSEFNVGDRVACAGGGYATHSEIVRVPRNLAALIPAGPGLREVPFDEAAFATVAAIALHGVRLAELQLGESVVILGLGLIGQVMVQLACAAGCTVIGMDPDESRCKSAEKMGCLATAQSDDEMKAISSQVTGGRGADAILIAAATSGNGPVTLAAELARDRGKVVSVGAVGLSLTRKPYYMKELSLRVSRSYGPGRYDPQYEEKGNDYPIGYVRWTEGRNLSAVLQLLAARKLDFAPLISHRFPIEQADRGYDLISGKTDEPFLGVIITYATQPSLTRRVQLAGSQAASRPIESGVRVGLIGAGNFASSVLLPAMKCAANTEFVGICASGGSSARAAGSRFGFRYCASDEAELFADATINTVVVCTRHASHARLVTQAMRHAKHIFCEKPLALNEQELSEVVAACSEEGRDRLLMLGYNRRFAPLAQHLKSFVASAVEPFVMHYRVNAGYIPGDHWTQDPEEGGGRILGEVCHFVDLLTFVCARPVVAVSAAVTPNAGRYSNDNLCATLWFADGSLGTITYTANGDKSFSKERVEVFVQGRVAVLDDFKELRTVHDGKHSTVKSRLRIDKGHRGEWEAFSKAIQGRDEAPIPFEQIVNSTLATLALSRSCSTGSRIEVDSAAFIADARRRRLSVPVDGEL